jgi:hypothetical protein
MSKKSEREMAKARAARDLAAAELAEARAETRRLSDQARRMRAAAEAHGVDLDNPAPAPAEPEAADPAPEAERAEPPIQPGRRLSSAQRHADRARAALSGNTLPVASPGGSAERMAQQILGRGSNVEISHDVLPSSPFLASTREVLSRTRGGNGGPAGRPINSQRPSSTTPQAKRSF